MSKLHEIHNIKGQQMNNTPIKLEKCTSASLVPCFFAFPIILFNRGFCFNAMHIKPIKKNADRWERDAKTMQIADVLFSLGPKHLPHQILAMPHTIS
jgi:hypothetical protein